MNSIGTCPICGREGPYTERVVTLARGGYFVDREYLDCGHVDVDEEGGV